MNAGDSSPQSLSFSTRNMPEKERVPYWREVFGRHVIRVDFTPKCAIRGGRITLGGARLARSLVGV